MRTHFAKWDNAADDEQYAIWRETPEGLPNAPPSHVCYGRARACKKVVLCTRLKSLNSDYHSALNDSDN